MTEQDILQLGLAAYNPNRSVEYRKAFEIIMGRKPNGCNCNNNRIYQDVKNYAEEKKKATENK